MRKALNAVPYATGYDAAYGCEMDYFGVMPTTQADPAGVTTFCS